ncbi:hypothetical protein SEVIR_5G296700v4 [Setaria viridis]
MPPGPPPCSPSTTTRRIATTAHPPSPSPSRRRGRAGWCSGFTTRRARTPRRSCRPRCGGSTTRTPTSLPLSSASSSTTASSTYVQTQTPCPASSCRRILVACDAHARTCRDAVLSWMTRVQGCDASVLLDRVGGRKSERDAAPNQSLRGFGAVDAIKRRVEAACPGTVSCADILALAARDSLVLVGGPTYPVLTGRRDSAQSSYYDVGGNIPGPNATYAMTLDAFARRGFTERETVALLGAHSIGKVRCRFFTDRIYNFAGTGVPDDSIDPDMVGEMRAVCGGDGAAPMEMGYYRQGREVGFGAHYYAKLLEGRGILRADQQLTAGSTVRWVRVYASGARGEEVFREDFAHAMVKLSALAPLTGLDGQVRISCSKPVEDN